MPDSVIFSIPGFEFSVAPTCTNQQRLNFSLFIEDSAGNYNQNFSLAVNAGVLTYQSYSISDPVPGGNNNGRLDPGESGKLFLMLQNSGSSDFYDVQVKLRSSDQYVLITDSTGHFGRLQAGESKTNSTDPFALSINPQAFSGYRAAVRIVQFALGGTYEIIDSLNLVLTIGQGGQSSPTGPDGYGYFVYDNTDANSGRAPDYNWEEISTTGQTIPEITNANDVITTMSLPFNFTYYGQSYNSISASSNGYLVMGTSSYNLGQNTPILSSCPNMIAPFWDDLDMRQQQQGYGDAYRYYDATNHRYIIEYRQAAHHGSRWTQETFEAILFDPAYYPTPTGDGEILFQYQTVTDATGNTVGICDATQTRGLQLLYNGEYESSVAGLISGRAFRFTTLSPQVNPAPWLGLLSINVNDSAGNGNGQPEPGENISLVVNLKNFGQVQTDSVSSVLRNQDSDAIMLDSIAGFGNIEPGGTANNSTTPYRVQIVANPSDSIADFALVLNANNGSYTTVLYFSLDLFGVVGIEERETRDEGRWTMVTKLECSPNPFSKRTVISWQLPEADRGLLQAVRIYNATGRLVKHLVPRQSSLVNVVTWDGTDKFGKAVPKGPYFVVLTDSENRVIINRKIVRAD
jgi:hypothetical protein